ncbi:MAG: ATP-binding protein [candidate division WOR-3 bacterium]
MDNLISSYLEIQHRLLKHRLAIRKREFWGEEEFDFEGRVWRKSSWEYKLAQTDTSDCQYYPQVERIIYEEQLQRVIEEAREKNITIPFERLCDEYGLNEDEKTILLVLFFAHFHGRSMSGASLLKLISSTIAEAIAKIEMFLPSGKLIKKGLIRNDEFRTFRPSVFEAGFKLTEHTFMEICGLLSPKENRNLSSVLLVREPEVSFDLLILPETVRERVEEALWRFTNGGRVFQEYGIADKIPYGTGTTMLFFGPPGTGKTATAEAIARALGKKLGVANYPRIYDCWFGDSEKNIQRVFQEAKEAECVLLFDEADALFGARLDEFHSTDRTHNLMTNILMQEIERFSGLVILTTNREFAMDRAFERRILLKLRFDIPDVNCRERIWQLFLKDCPRLAPDVSFRELATRYPLTGGKIKNAVIKAVIAAAQQERPVTMADLDMMAKEEMGKELKKEIGF